MKTVRLDFDADLVGFLPKAWHRATMPYAFTGPQTVKHLVESLGIPHTEIQSVESNGSPSNVGYLVQDGDRIAVHAVRADSNGEPRFAIDCHLGRLAARLRMLGLDCEYRNDITDDQLLNLAADGQRTLLSRDRRLLMRKVVRRGCLVRSLDPLEQVLQVVARFNLRPWVRPFSRCIRCNHLLESIAKHEVVARLEPLTRLYFDGFRMCPACNQIYWKGSHLAKMEAIIRDLGFEATGR
ncbi:MAG TPA: Mut7-C RNAse domain-containing protein [Anaerolineales bacterium]